MPKEMLPIVDKPAISIYCGRSRGLRHRGISLIITNRGKGLLEDHFDRAPSWNSGLPEIRKGRNPSRNYRYFKACQYLLCAAEGRQKAWDALINCARYFVENEPFAVLYGDDVIIGEDPACAQLIRAYEQFGNGVVGVKEVSP